MLNEIFLSLFAVTFFVALIAFSAYGYMLYTLLRHRSNSFQIGSVIEFLVFLWKLLIYYINRALVGFFAISISKDADFLKVYDHKIKDAEADTERMISAYKVFSSAYILFFILLLCLFVVILYMVTGPAI